MKVYNNNIIEQMCTTVNAELDILYNNYYTIVARSHLLRHITELDTGLEEKWGQGEEVVAHKVCEKFFTATPLISGLRPIN